ncbi:response regulator [Gloeocapsa sp. PCC 7428]|uniref:response regulator n=1 Tax=Gloeocapsa sp. PCC 7428 TaxID=1173026 RepID=UPI001E2C190D|nr:response regulator [Gloeocapsa sp. PCC 7428]
MDRLRASPLQVLFYAPLGECLAAAATKISHTLLRLFLSMNMNLQSSSNSPQQDQLRQPLVLAVDDNEDNLQLLAQLLMLIECSHITATDGQTAVIMAQNYQPNLILLDMMLPDLDGIEVVSRLKQNPETMEIPIVAVTAMAREEDQQRFLRAGCKEYIKKPYIIEELEATIRRCLG